MSVFRYVALRMSAQPAERVVGEAFGESPEHVRASLRRVGLSVVELKPLRKGDAAARSTVRSAWHEHLRQRRCATRAEIYDGVATMLDSGMPLLQSIEAIARSGRHHARARAMLAQLRDSLRSGGSLAQAFEAQPDWFSSLEVAMVEAGARAGNLAQVLRDLSERHERTGRLMEKLAGALAYPAAVFVLGLGVVTFLSTRTLPELVTILRNANVEPPALTLKVMATGSFFADYGLALLAVAAASVLTVLFLRARAISLLPDAIAHRLRPELLRKAAIAGVATSLAQLVRTGVPVLDALRVIAPTVKSRSLQEHIKAAATRIERGMPLSDALADPRFFDEEFVRLVEVGQATGELAPLLSRVGERLQRSAQRSLDRLAAVIEPVSILALAAMVGTVALAAVLPLFRLQEIL